MADDIARALEALAEDSKRCAPSSASAIRRRGDHRRVAMRAAATGATMTVVGATAGTAVAVAHQTPSGDSRLTISGSPSPSSSLSPAPVSIICETNPQRPLGLTAREFKQQQKAKISASRGQRKHAKHVKHAAMARRAGSGCDGDGQGHADRDPAQRSRFCQSPATRPPWARRVRSRVPADAEPLAAIDRDDDAGPASSRADTQPVTAVEGEESNGRRRSSQRPHRVGRIGPRSETSLAVPSAIVWRPARATA